MLDLLAAGALLAALAALAAWLPAAQGPIRATARVIDGDTLDLAGRRIRLAGMDAPELAQTCDVRGEHVRCGEVARAALVGMVGTRPVSCRAQGRDRYGRILAVCEAGERDLGRWLVRQGYAVPYGSYAREGRAAEAEHLGLWAGTFEAPSAWRRAHPLGGTHAADGS